MPASAPVQNWIDFNIDVYTRAVTLGANFGAMPPHIKRGDQREFRIRFFNSTAPDAEPLELADLDHIKFGAKEKGRYDDGSFVAFGQVNASAWDATLKCYKLPLTFDGDVLLQLLSQQLQTNFGDGDYDDILAIYAAVTGGSTTTISSGTEGNTTTTTGPTQAQPLPLLDMEFMAEFEWSQSSKTESTVTFSLFLARDVIANATANGGDPVTQPATAPTDWRSTAAMVGEGNVAAGDVFGFFEAQVALEILGIEVATKQPDATHGFRVQLTDAAGADLGGGTNYYGNVPANTAFATLTFGSVLSLNPGDKVRAKFKNYTGDNAAGVVVNLRYRQYSSAQPSGPSGPPAITSVAASTLEPGATATAQLVGQLLQLGLPRGAKGDPGDDGTLITEAVAETLPPGSAATVDLEGGVLTVGVPQGEPGENGSGVTGVQLQMVAADVPGSAQLAGTTLMLSIPRAPSPAASNRDAAAGATTAYNASSATVFTFEFDGRGKPAAFQLSFENNDTSGNQNVAMFALVRADLPDDPLARDSRVMIAGRSLPISFFVLDPQTTNGPQEYRLQVFGYNNASGGLSRVGGSAVNPRMKVVGWPT